MRLLFSYGNLHAIGFVYIFERPMTLTHHTVIYLVNCGFEIRGQYIPCILFSTAEDNIVFYIMKANRNDIIKVTQLLVLASQFFFISQYPPIF